MNPVRLYQVSNESLLVLQAQLLMYPASLPDCDVPEALLAYDISNRLWKTLRTKVESGRAKHSFSLKASEAVILMRCCLWNNVERGVYEATICLKYGSEIHQALTSADFRAAWHHKINP